MSVPRLLACDDDGPSVYCYVQRDGGHIQQSACTCSDKVARYSLTCPVDFHREAAEALRDGEAARDASSANAQRIQPKRC